MATTWQRRLPAVVMIFIGLVFLVLMILEFTGIIDIFKRA